jgi:serine protease Do
MKLGPFVEGGSEGIIPQGWTFGEERDTMKNNVVAWAALVVSAAALAGPRFMNKPVGAVQEIPAEGQKAARALSEAFGAVADFARPSVVQISVNKKVGGFRVGEGTGSGFVYDDHGHILTNNHVVAGADQIEVTFHDGETAKAKVVGTDADADVAVIQVDTTQYRALPKGKSDKLRVGEWVMAIGSPFGLDQTVTAGIISATERENMKINKYESFLQTDCAINPGNSGGPLVDMNGRVVGINSAIATSSRSNAGVGFAIPMDMASVLADKLIKDGRVSRALVGLLLSKAPMTPSVAKKLGLAEKTHGVLVRGVVEGSPAAKAGVETGDVIVEFDGHLVSTESTFRNLVSASDAGKSYALKFIREGKTQEAKVTPALEKDIQLPFEREQ